MRRTIAALVCAAAAALATPALTAPAHAQAAKPVIRKQFVAGRGVHIATSGTIGSRQGIAVKYHDEGDVQFGTSGIAATDTTSTMDWGGLFGDDDVLQGLDGPTRTITVKGTSYQQGGIFSDLLPPGKTWLALTGGDPAASLSAGFQLVDVFRPGLLKALLATTAAKGAGGTEDRVRTTAYRGTITLGGYYTAYYGDTPQTRRLLSTMSAEERRSPLYWRVWIGSDGLVRHVSTAIRASLGTEKNAVKGTGDELVLRSSTRLTHWGGKVRITPPPADQVAQLKDLISPIPDIPDYINLGD
ncbi:hypothetical protein GCM10009530_06880 [Microbispora corallina]|uniref:Uncharacterized protein n=1 Tax=Microbispora corallina TaxID=83302 RepID=A0ABQ4FV04_9ACTN|nr:hypothetical protein [Microbispora corallina]GIH38651.1 hypothetical protein Mco01_16510 [Microbispora corallina]